jgi:hypothetical protein
MVLLATPATAQSSGNTASETVVTLQDKDVNGTQRVSERVVTRTLQSKDGEEVVIDTYSATLYRGRLTLSQRVRRVTTVTSDGNETVEETEEPPRGSPHEPMRVVTRSVTTVRRIGPDSYETEKRVFQRDVNGRFVPIETQIERSSRR